MSREYPTGVRDLAHSIGEKLDALLRQSAASTSRTERGQSFSRRVTKLTEAQRPRITVSDKLSDLIKEPDTMSSMAEVRDMRAKARLLESLWGRQAAATLEEVAELTHQLDCKSMDS